MYITFSCRANAGSACRSVTRKIPDRRAKKENGAGGSKVREPRAAGTQFTCFTVTKLQILTQQQRRTAGGGLSHTSQAASRTSSEPHFPEMLPVGKRFSQCTGFRSRCGILSFKRFSSCCGMVEFNGFSSCCGML